MGRVFHIANLSPAQRAELEFLARSRSGGLAKRAHAVLLSSEGKSIREIASRTHLHYQNVRKWLHRYSQSGIGGLQHRGKGKSRNLRHGADVRQRIAEIAATTPESLGLPFRDWSLPQLRDHLIAQGVVAGISPETIRRILTDRGIDWRRPGPWQANAAQSKGLTLPDGRLALPPRLAIRFDPAGRASLHEPVDSPLPQDLELLCEHYQKGVSEIHAIYDGKTRSITLRLFRETRDKAGKDE